MNGNIDRDRFLEEGYIIVEGLIPPDELEDLRHRFEIMVDRQRAIWAAARGPDDPPGGLWETDSQPRLIFQNLVPQIDAETAPTVEFWTREIHDISSHLLAIQDAPVVSMMMMCSPMRDHGTADHQGWHRDVYPPFSAPFQAYTDSIAESGPRYMQWNVPLYDDDVLWVMPGSHRRLNTEAENQFLRERQDVPMPGAVHAKLKGGDAVGYITPIMHWGSNYDSRLRRTIHGGFSKYAIYPDLSFVPRLAEPAQRLFEGWQSSSERMQDLTETALRSAIGHDRPAYDDSLEQLHPGSGDKARTLTTVFLSKTARRINDLRNTDFDRLPDGKKWEATFLHPLTLDWGREFAERFDAAEAEAMWERFKPVDEMLHAEEEISYLGFEDRPSRHYFGEMPEGLDTSVLTGDW